MPNRGPMSGWVLLSQCAWIFDEIERRVGQEAGAAGIGISDTQFRSALYRRHARVQKRTVRGAILFLRELREQGIHKPRSQRKGRPGRFYPVQGSRAASLARSEFRG